MPQPPGSESPALPWSRVTEAAVVAGIWILFMAVSVVARGLLDPIPLTWHTVATALIEYGPWLVTTPLVLWAARCVPLARPRWTRGLVLHAALAVATVTVVGEVHAAGFRQLGPPPGLRSVSGERPRFGRPEMGGPDGDRGGGMRTFWTPSLNVFLYLALLGAGVGRAQAVLSAARRADAERAEAEAVHLRAQVAEAHLAALRMQLRPHFLFNALNAVAAYADDDPEQVRHIVARLSSLLRRVLDADARPLITLGEELAFARDYLDLQRVRFERLDVDEDVDPGLLGVLVPSLVLQPLVENAVEHGAAGRPGGHVWIRAQIDGAQLALSVADNGPGLDAERGPAHRSVGLENTRARLDAHYGDAARLDLRDRPEGGAEATLTLPILPDDDDD